MARDSFKKGEAQRARTRAEQDTVCAKEMNGAVVEMRGPSLIFYRASLYGAPSLSAEPCFDRVQALLRMVVVRVCGGGGRVEKQSMSYRGTVCLGLCCVVCLGCFVEPSILRSSVSFECGS